MKFVLGCYEDGISTKTSFELFDKSRYIGKSNKKTIDGILAGLARSSYDDIAKNMYNNLQPIAIKQKPIIQKTIDMAIKSGALNSIVTGSGPTVVALCSNDSIAKKVASKWENNKLTDTCYIFRSFP
jgi:4-diphosphocytidyl-2-C-methyl-D-erythritol kinase